MNHGHFENIQKALHNVATNPQPNLFGKSIEYYTFEGLTPYLPFPANVITANLWLFSLGIYGISLWCATDFLEVYRPSCP